MGARLELPHIIHKRLKHDDLVRAIQENFDALTGEVTYVTAAIASSSKAATEAAVERSGESSVMSVSEMERHLAEAGVGAEDGDAPTDAPTNVRVIGGVGNFLLVTWNTIANSSGVRYKVYVSATNGFTAGATNYVGEWLNPGQAGGIGVHMLREFPVGHSLAGTNPQQGTTYYARVRAADADGDGPLSAQSSDTPDTISASLILAAGTVLAGHIGAGQIDATKINVGSLSAINANLGTVISGSLNGVVITGGTVRTSSGNNRIEFVDDSGVGRIRFYDGGAIAAVLYNDGTGMHVSVPGGGIVNLTASRFDLAAGQTIQLEGTTTPSVSSGGATAVPATPRIWVPVDVEGVGVRHFALY